MASVIQVLRDTMPGRRARSASIARKTSIGSLRLIRSSGRGAWFLAAAGPIGAIMAPSWLKARMFLLGSCGPMPLRPQIQRPPVWFTCSPIAGLSRRARRPAAHRLFPRFRGAVFWDRSRWTNPRRPLTFRGLPGRMKQDPPCFSNTRINVALTADCLNEVRRQLNKAVPYSQILKRGATA